MPGTTRPNGSSGADTFGDEAREATSTSAVCCGAVGMGAEGGGGGGCALLGRIGHHQLHRNMSDIDTGSGKLFHPLTQHFI